MRWGVFCIAILFTLNVAHLVYSAPLYVFTDLGTTSQFTPRAINSYGEIVGYSIFTGGITRATLWKPTKQNGTAGSITNLGDLPGGNDFSQANDINEFGQIVGSGSTMQNTTNVSHPFLWTPVVQNGTSGSMTDLGQFSDSSASATAINSFGQVVGTSNFTNSFLWTPSSIHGTTGTRIGIGSLGGSTKITLAHGINSSGQITGVSNAASGDQVFLWSPTSAHGMIGSMTNVGDESGGSNYTSGEEINDSGVIVGQRDKADVNGVGGHAFIWTPSTPNSTSGTMSNILDLPFTLGSGFGAINNLGIVAGSGRVSGAASAFIWSQAENSLDLNSVVDLGSIYSRLFSVVDINDYGQVVGSWSYDSDGAGPIAGVNHGFLLTPVPETTSLAYGALCMLSLARCSRRSGEH